jgi:lactoylglutathione lyase
MCAWVRQAPTAPRRGVDQQTREAPMAKAIHTMIRVLDLDRSIAFYDQAFGLKVADRFDFDDFALVYLRNDENDFEIELTLNRGQTEPYTHGDGYGHLAVCVADAKAERRRFDKLGLSPNDVKEFYRDDTLMARFFFVQDPDGYKIEVLERHGRYV